MNVLLPCGREFLAVTVPDRAVLVESDPASVPVDQSEAVRAALARPLNRPALVDLARGRTRVQVVVSDLSRPVPHAVLLPPIFEALTAADLTPDQVSILVATGMHQPLSPEELASLVGPDLAARYRVLNHDCLDAAAHVQVTRIEDAPIEIDRRYLQADLKILTGLVEPHHIAGFSGGGKSILPGLSSFRTMEFMHSFAMIQDPRVGIARMKENPFQRYVRQVAELVGIDFLVNVTIDRERRVTGVFAGELAAAHDAGCALAAKHGLRLLDHPADLVIITAGGRPLDLDFYQGCKGLIAAREAACPGARCLLVAECAAGLGQGDFRAMIEARPTPEDFFNHHARLENFTRDQWAAQRVYQGRTHFSQIFIYAPGLSPEEAGRLGAIKVYDLQATADRLCAEAEHIAVIPEGPYVATQIRCWA